MLQTYSPSGSESGLAKLLKFEMERLGFNTRIDEVGNVVGEIGTEGPELLLCGHMDTVPSDIPVGLEDGTLYGRGAVDAKTSLATMILGASKAILEDNVPLRVRLACVVEEETTSKGFRTILAHYPRPQLAVFGEPSGSANIIIGYKGRIQAEVECMTDGGHAASPWVSKNSIEEAFAFWTNLRRFILSNDSDSKFNAVTGC